MPESKLLRILIIDDDPGDRALLTTLLQSLEPAQRYRIQTASRYEEGLREILSGDHDVALVNFQLGPHTGVDMLRATERDPRRPPMIILTGHGNPDIDRLCLESGASDFLVKARLDNESLARSLRYAVERRRLNLLLAERDREYRNLFDASPMPMWVYDPETLRIIEVNAAATQEYGYERHEFMALRVSDLLSDEDQRHVVAGDDIATSSFDHAGIRRDRRKNGEIIDVEVVCSDIRFGSHVARLALVNNVSARLCAEATLRVSESTMRQILRDAADGLLVAGLDDRILFANPAASRILGRAESDLIGDRVPDTLLGTARESLELHDAAGGGVHVVDLCIGNTQWNDVSARVLTLHDVTAQHAYADQLVLLRRAVESTADGLLIADLRLPDQQLIYVNSAFETITGYSAQECIGRNCRFLQGEDHDQEAIAAIRSAIAEERDCSVILRNYRKDGVLFWNRLTLSPVRQGGDRITHYVGAMSDITAQKQLEAEHLYLATYDTVTGLPRYVGSEDRLNQRIQRAQNVDETSAGQRLVFLFIDVDNFNTINDTMGFVTGDAALRQLANLLVDAAGAGADVLRYAGDEFLIVLNADMNADLLKLANSFCERVAEPLAVSPTVSLYLSVSVGVSAYPDTGATAVELTRQAEIATNRAKRGGRNGAFVFGQELREALGDRIALGGRMRDALANGEFLLHYQPQVNAQDGALTAVEALVRWSSPEFGLLPPRRFVSIAEDSGMMLQLGAWVLRSACCQLRQWMDAGFRGFLVSVNVSAAQLQRPNFVADVRRTIEETGIDPSLLELELTESGLMGNSDRVVAQMHELKCLGVRLALDDFGMGYSSLSYLRRFPIDKLKIDRTFINHIVQEGNDAALVRAMISVGHHLGLRVVAEGVETAAQVGYLRRNHCDEFQGHYFSAALPAIDIPDLVRRRYLIPSAPSEEQTRTLLMLDDEENIRRSLLRLLRRDGYRILQAASASEAFELLATHRVQVIISDQRMPGMSGTKFLSQVKAMYPDTVRMVLSGFTDLASVTDAINRGAIYKFLTKPWDDEELRAQVLEAFRRFETAGAV